MGYQLGIFQFILNALTHWATVQNVWKEIAENLDFVENSDFIRESIEAAFHGCSVINSQENTCGGVVL